MKNYDMTVFVDHICFYINVNAIDESDARTCARNTVKRYLERKPPAYKNAKITSINYQCADITVEDVNEN